MVLLACASIFKIEKNNRLFSSFFLCVCTLGFSQEKAPLSEQPPDRVNFPSHFQVEEGANVFTFGDYLYWIAQENSLYYAHTGKGTGTTIAPPDGSIDFKGDLKKIDPEWDHGFRIGLGLNFPKEGYDVLLTWTWFETSAHRCVHSSLGNLLTLWARPDFSSSGAFFARGKWNLNLNYGDCEWGRSSWFGGHFSLRPFFSIRGLWIDQKLKNHYDYNTTPIVVGDLHLTSDVHGAGLRTGAEIRFALPYDFAIYGIASGSLLYGRFNTKMEFKEDAWMIAKTKDPFWKGISSLQLALGLGWDHHFCHDHCHLEFHMGWEQNSWFSVNQIHHYLNQLHKGVFFKENSSLTLQGLVVGGRFDF